MRFNHSFKNQDNGQRMLHKLKVPMSWEKVWNSIQDYSTFISREDSTSFWFSSAVFNQKMCRRIVKVFLSPGGDVSVFTALINFCLMKLCFPSSLWAYWDTWLITFEEREVRFRIERKPVSSLQTVFFSFLFFLIVDCFVHYCQTRREIF